MNNKKSGFTLVGMLITLVVLGVVFMFMMPTLKVNNKANNKQQSSDVKQVSYQALVEKSYIEINQALGSLPADYSCDNLQCTGLFAPGTGNQALGDALAKHINFMKNCGITSNTECFSNAVIDPTDTTGTRLQYDTASGYYRAITNFGTSVLINNNGDNCTGVYLGASTCGYIIIDVNGLQNPNTFGKDIFYFYITNTNGNNLSPMGGIANHFGK